MLLPIKRKLRGWAIRTAPMWVRYLYPTPKLDVRGVVFSEQELLLVRDSADGRWSLPGGWIDLRESVGEAAAREVLEESGHAVTPVKLIAVSNIRRRQDGRPMRVNVFRMFVLCTPDGHEAVSIKGVETSEAAFFAENELPELSTGRGTHDELARAFLHLRDPDRPCDFD